MIYVQVYSPGIMSCDSKLGKQQMLNIRKIIK